MWSFVKRQIFKLWMYSKNTNNLKDLLDIYIDVNLMKTCHVVFKTVNYGVGISFKYFLRKIWGVWSFEWRQILKCLMPLLWFNCLYKYKYYKTFHGKPKVAFKSKVNFIVPPITSSSVSLMYIHIFLIFADSQILWACYDPATKCSKLL